MVSLSQVISYEKELNELWYRHGDSIPAIRLPIHCCTRFKLFVWHIMPLQGINCPARLVSCVYQTSQENSDRQPCSSFLFPEVKLILANMLSLVQHQTFGNHIKIIWNKVYLHAIKISYHIFSKLHFYPNFLVDSTLRWWSFLTSVSLLRLLLGALLSMGPHGFMHYY